MQPWNNVRSRSGLRASVSYPLHISRTLGLSSDILSLPLVFRPRRPEVDIRLLTKGTQPLPELKVSRRTENMCTADNVYYPACGCWAGHEIRNHCAVGIAFPGKCRNVETSGILSRDALCPNCTKTQSQWKDYFPDADAAAFGREAVVRESIRKASTTAVISMTYQKLQERRLQESHKAAEGEPA